jgi:CrcB protein
LTASASGRSIVRGDTTNEAHEAPGNAVRVIWYVAIGAGVGGVSRYLLASFIQERAGPGFPMGTLIINITGSLLLGFIARYALTSGAVSPEMRALLTTGFCGGYTTFSTFSYETVLLMEDGEYGRAGLYIGLSLGLSLLAMFLGFVAASRLLALRDGL